MDPFSIATGAIGVADVCFRVVHYLRQLNTSRTAIQTEINSLISEIEALRSLCDAVEQASLSDTPSKDNGEESRTVAMLGGHLRRSLSNCKDVVTRLEGLAQDIYGPTGEKVANVFDAVGKATRKLSKMDEFRQCREQLSTYQSAMQILLMTITL